MWLIMDLDASIFAALTYILAKIDIDSGNSNLCTAIRTCVALLISWGMVFLTKAQAAAANE